MQCPKCGHDNPPEALFCEECDWRLDLPVGATPKTKKRNPLAFAVLALVVGLVSAILIFVDGAEYGAIGVGAVGLILGSYSVNLPRYLNPNNKSVCMGLATAGVVLSVFGFILGFAAIAGVF